MTSNRGAGRRIGTRRSTFLLVPLAFLFAVAACTGQPGPVSGTSVAPVSAPAATEPADASAGGTPGQAVDTLPVLGSLTAEIPAGTGGGGPVAARMDLNELRVTGSIVQMTLTAYNMNTDGPRGQKWQLGDSLGDGQHDAADPFDTADGLYLLDAANNLRYLPGRVEDGSCVCAQELSSVLIVPGASAVITATFAAPPDGVDRVDVVVPTFGTLSGIEVDR